MVMAVRLPKSQVGRHVMIAMLQFATLVITTMFAAAAVGLHWLFLRAAFLMMRPATARRIPPRTELVHGPGRLAPAPASPRRAGHGVGGLAADLRYCVGLTAASRGRA